MKMLKVPNKAPCGPSPAITKKQSISAPQLEEHESPGGESRVSFSLANIDIFPRETVQHKQTRATQQNERAMHHGQIQAARRVLQAREEAPPNKTGMPNHLKSGLENLSGIDLSGVRVHFSSAKPAQLNALAYTHGQDIHLAPGQERHLPHEGWHVVQQKQGRVKPTKLAKGVAINDDAALEFEADLIGSRALKMTSNQVVTPPTPMQLRKGAESPFSISMASSALQQQESDHRAHYMERSCSACHRTVLVQRVGLPVDSNAPVQLRRIGDGERYKSMIDAARFIQGDSDRSTTAVGEVSGNNFIVYAQVRTPNMESRISEYDNAYIGSLNGQTGFHAEVNALRGRRDFLSIAASQPICARCEALLNEQNIIALNTGNHFTRLWNAPWDKDINVRSRYPYGADGGGGQGLNGTRWGFSTNSGKEYVIDRSVWTHEHPNGW